MAAARLGDAIGEIRLIAAHAWDVAAFVARPGQVLDPLAPRPDIVGADVNEVADGILDADR